MKTLLTILMLAGLSAGAESVTVGKARTLHAVSKPGRTLCGYSTANAIGTNAITCKFCMRLVAKGGGK